MKNKQDVGTKEKTISALKGDKNGLKQPEVTSSANGGQGQTAHSAIEDDSRSKFQAIFEDISGRKLVEKDRERLIRELQEALSKVKKLSGFLPICASCKRIRDDQGYWNQIEAYISEHSEIDFSHGICPECAQKLYKNLK